MTALDRRLNAFRPDLGDVRLRGQIETENLVEGRPMRVIAPIADLRKQPRPDSGIDTQLIYGDDVLMFEDAEGWCWVQNERDGYVGYVTDTALDERAAAPTHRVTAPRTFVYPGPDLKFPVIKALSMGSLLSVTGWEERRGTQYAVLSSGEAVVARHIAPIDDRATDFVAVAESLINTPYLWGGVSGFGIDCSGLVQLSLLMAGKNVLRDSDMQAQSIGNLIETDASYDRLQRGDLVFWNGHAAMMADDRMLLHASGYTMSVTLEPLTQAIERIMPFYGLPTCVRRI
ncbi:MAG: NlpC/P60 family protein [Phyllobacterium sp.]